MVYELLHNNRTVGADEENIGNEIKELYSCFCEGEIVVEFFQLKCFNF